MAADLTLHGWKQGVARQPQDASRIAKNRTQDRLSTRMQERRKSKAAHAETELQRRIVTYSLSRDQLPRLDGTTGAARMADNMIVPGSGIAAAAVPLALPQLPQKPARQEVLRTEAADSAGIAFGCRERPFSGQNRREVTACFRHSVDRSWKAQTYLSRGIVEGTQTWGGGMSIAYDY